MAAASCTLSEERFLCPVCLDVFTYPVSTPCGHNFCSACIHKCWDSSDVCQCPICTRTFSARPELNVNTLLSELADLFIKSARVKSATPDPRRPATTDVPCDICSQMKEKATKSCLTCLTSFCKLHLEPHQRVAVLRGHTLTEPVRNLDERMCKKHNKATELFCRTDQACICVLCFRTSHRAHKVVSQEEQFEALMAKKDDAIANIQKMIQLRFEKTRELEGCVDVSQRQAEEAKEASRQVFTDLICSLQRGQANFVREIEERHRKTEEEAGGFLEELRMEIAELESRRRRLEQLSQSEDRHHFIQSFPHLSSPPNKDWTNVGVCADLFVDAVMGTVSLWLRQEAEKILEETPELKWKGMREHAVDLTLDPDTAHWSLVIRQGGKQVKRTDKKQSLPNNPKRFEMFPEVLAKEGFRGGRFYYEVAVKGKSWIIGVARESVERKTHTELTPANGFWTLQMKEGSCSVPLALAQGLQRVGIFVDYDKGTVSFYDADSKSHILSFTGNQFKDKLFPYFCPHSAPLTITPVP